MLKELFKGSAIYGLAPFIPKILTVLLLPLLTKYLTSVDYGIIGTITAVTFALQALQSLGLNALLPNYFYKCRTHYKIIWREVYGFLSLWMIAYALSQAVLLYFFIPEEAADNKWLIIVLSNFSTVFFGPTAIIGRMYYQLNLRPVPVASRLVLSGVSTVAVNCLCVAVFHLGYLGAYIGSFAGTFIANMSYWPVVNRKLGLSPIYNFKWRTIRNLLKVSTPTIPHYYSTYLLNSTNVIAMNYYGKPQSEVGHLTMAQSISGMFDTFLNAINQVWSPMSYKFIRDKNRGEMKRILFTYVLLAFSATFLYSLWSREAYGILISNEEIAATYKYSILLVMALSYRPFYVYCINYFLYFEHTVQMLGITFVSGVISFIFYFAMTPVWGIYAALIGFYLGCLYLGYSGYFYSFYREATIYKVKWPLFVFVQLFLTVVAYICVDSSIVIKIFISLAYLSLAGVVFIKKIKGNVRFVKKSI